MKIIWNEPEPKITHEDMEPIVNSINGFISSLESQGIRRFRAFEILQTIIANADVSSNDDPSLVKVRWER